MIVEKSFKRHYNKNQREEDWKEDRNINSLRFHMLTEGNNCTFFMRHISNVLIRWDSKLDSKIFRYHKEKKVKENPFASNY